MTGKANLHKNKIVERIGLKLLLTVGIIVCGLFAMPGIANAEDPESPVTINVTEIELIIPDGGYVYDKTAKEPEVIVKTSEGNVDKNTYNYSITYNDNVNAGENTARVTISSPDNTQFVLEGTLTATFSIAQKKITINWSNPEFEYDKNSHVPTATAAGLEGVDSCNINVTGAQTNAGRNYEATAASLDNGNYALPETGTTWNFDITEKEVGLDWSEDSFTYDGASHKPTATATDLYEGDVCNVIVSGEQTDAGENYTASADSLSNQNYKLPSERTHTFRIQKADSSVTQPPEGDANLIYTGLAQNLISRVGDCSAGTMKYAIGDSEPDAEAFTETVTGTGYGTYKVWYKGSGDSNHNPTTADFIEVSIGKAPLSVTPDPDQSKEYGEDDSALTYTATGFVNNETASVLSGSLTRQEGIDPGEYSILQGTLTAANYEITFDPNVKYKIYPKTLQDSMLIITPISFGYDGSPKTPGISVKENETTPLEPTTDYVIDPSSVLSATEVGSTYSISVNGTGKYRGTVTKNWSINQGAPTYTEPTPKTLTYTGSPQDLVNPGSAEGGTMKYAIGTNTAATESYSTGIPQATGAGEHYVWYKVEGTGGYGDTAPACIRVDIAKKVPDITAPQAKTGITYNGHPHELINAGESDSGTLKYALGDETHATQAYSSAIPQGENAGTYYVWFKAEENTNYEASREDKIPVTISKERARVETAPVPVENLTYDGSEKSLLSSGGTAIGGIMNYRLGEAGAWVTNYSVIKGTDAKEYEVWYKVAGTENYEDSTPQKILVSIAKVPSTVSTDPQKTADFTYDGTEHELFSSAGAATNGTMQYRLGESGEWKDNYRDIKGKEAKSYKIYYRSKGDANYSDTTPVEMTVEISKAGIVLTAKDQTITYGDNVSSTASQYTITGVVSGETPTVTLSASISDSKVVPSVVVEAGSALTTNNYTVAITKGNLTINPAPLTVTPDSGQFKAKGATDPVLTFSVSGLKYNDTKSVVTGTLKRTPGEDIGKYEISNNDLAAPHYTITVTSGVKFEIVEEAVEVKEKPTAKNPVYNDTYQKLISSGKATGGTMKYGIGTADKEPDKYDGEIPTAKKAGKYYVWYKAENGSASTKPVMIEAYIRQEISIGWYSTVSWTYDGEYHAPEAYPKESSLLEGHTRISLYVSGSKRDVGDNYTAKVTEIYGVDADYYALPDSGLTKTFSIKKASSGGNNNNNNNNNNTPANNNNSNNNNGNNNNSNNSNNNNSSQNNSPTSSQPSSSSSGSSASKPSSSDTASGGGGSGETEAPQAVDTGVSEDTLRQLADNTKIVDADNTLKSIIGEAALNSLKASGQSPAVKLSVTPLSVISSDEKMITEESINYYSGSIPNLMPGAFLDVSLMLKATGTWQIVSSTANPVTFVIDIPEEFQKKSEEFYVLRIHGRKATLLYDQDNDPKTVTIDSDLFSTYVLMYPGNNAGTNTSTNTTSRVNSLLLLWIIVGVIIIAILIFLLIYFLFDYRRREMEAEKNREEDKIDTRPKW